MALNKNSQRKFSLFTRTQLPIGSVRYKLPEGIEKGQLIVTSTAGQQMITLTAQGQQGILTLNTSNWLVILWCYIHRKKRWASTSSLSDKSLNFCIL